MTGHTANGRGLDNLDWPRGLPLSQSRSSMAFRIGRLLVAALLLLVALPAAAEERVRVAVLPVLVHSDGPEDYLRDGLADMLASRLDQQAGVEVVRVESAEQATVELEAARAAGKTLGADYVLFGSFTHFGEGASLDLACAPVPESDAPPRAIFVQSGTLGEIIPRLNELAQKVARYLQGPSATPPVSAAPPEEDSLRRPARRPLRARRASRPRGGARERGLRAGAGDPRGGPAHRRVRRRGPAGRRLRRVERGLSRPSARAPSCEAPGALLDFASAPSGSDGAHGAV